MPRFRLSTLLGVVVIVCLLLALYVSREDAAKQERQLAIAQRQAYDYREELGRINVVDPTRYQVRQFYEQFIWDFPADWKPGDIRPREYRFRVYCPDPTKCKICYEFGKLPKNGFPEPVKTLPWRGDGLLPEPVEMTIIFRAYPSRGGGLGVISFQSKYTNQTKSKQVLHLALSRGWVKKMNQPGMTLYTSPYAADEPFDLSQPVVIMRRAYTDAEGDDFGMLIWLEPNPPIEFPEINRSAKRTR